MNRSAKLLGYWRRHAALLSIRVALLSFAAFSFPASSVTIDVTVGITHYGFDDEFEKTGGDIQLRFIPFPDADESKHKVYNKVSASCSPYAVPVEFVKLGAVRVELKPASKRVLHRAITPEAKSLKGGIGSEQILFDYGQLTNSLIRWRKDNIKETPLGAVRRMEPEQATEAISGLKEFTASCPGDVDVLFTNWHMLNKATLDNHIRKVIAQARDLVLQMAVVVGESKNILHHRMYLVAATHTFQRLHNRRDEITGMLAEGDDTPSSSTKRWQDERVELDSSIKAVAEQLRTFIGDYGDELVEGTPLGEGQRDAMKVIGEQPENEYSRAQLQAFYNASEELKKTLTSSKE